MTNSADIRSSEKLTSSIFAKGKEGLDVRVNLFRADPQTMRAYPIELPMKTALKSSLLVIDDVKRARAEFEPQGPAVDDKILKFLLDPLAMLGIRPVGEMYFTSGHVSEGGGHALPLLRIAEIHRFSDGGIPLFEVFFHELTHLATMGFCDDLIALHNENDELIDYFVLNCGWERPRRPIELIRDRNGHIRVNRARRSDLGVFFEEVTAGLVACQFSTDLTPKYKKLGVNFSQDSGPSVYEANGKVFAVPDGFGHNGHVWAVLQLEAHCPGVVEILLDGARGHINIPALRHAIDGRFPGLFDELDGIDLNDTLASGAVKIIERLSD